MYKSIIFKVIRSNSYTFNWQHHWYMKDIWWPIYLYYLMVGGYFRLMTDVIWFYIQKFVNVLFNFKIIATDWEKLLFCEKYMVKNHPRREGSIILGYMKFLCIFLWNKIIAVKFEIKHKILLKWKEFIDDESTLNISFIYRWTQLYQSQRKFTKEKMLLMKTKSTFLELHH